MDRRLVEQPNRHPKASSGQLLVDALGMGCRQEHSMVALLRVRSRQACRLELVRQKDLGPQELVRRMDHPKVVEHVRR